MHVHLAMFTDVETDVISSMALKQRKWCVVVDVCSEVGRETSILFAMLKSSVMGHVCSFHRH